MAPRIDELLAHIAQLEREVEAELNEASRASFGRAARATW
jgi:outer membrane murein-binding lipoprotein Lpp